MPASPTQTTRPPAKCRSVYDAAHTESKASRRSRDIGLAPEFPGTDERHMKRGAAWVFSGPHDVGAGVMWVLAPSPRARALRRAASLRLRRKPLKPGRRTEPRPPARGDGVVRRLNSRAEVALTGPRVEAKPGDWMLRGPEGVAVVSSTRGAVIDFGAEGGDDALVALEPKVYVGLDDMASVVESVDAAGPGGYAVLIRRRVLSDPAAATLDVREPGRGWPSHRVGCDRAGRGGARHHRGRDGGVGQRSDVGRGHRVRRATRPPSTATSWRARAWASPTRSKARTGTWPRGSTSPRPGFTSGRARASGSRACRRMARRRGGS